MQSPVLKLGADTPLRLMLRINGFVCPEAQARNRILRVGDQILKTDKNVEALQFGYALHPSYLGPTPLATCRHFIDSLDRIRSLDAKSTFPLLFEILEGLHGR